MPNYRLEISSHAESLLKRVALRDAALYQRVEKALDLLEHDPFQGKPLKGRLKGRYSYRVGDYRIVYVIHRQILLVLVIDFGHRQGVYD